MTMSRNNDAGPADLDHVAKESIAEKRQFKHESLAIKRLRSVVYEFPNRPGFPMVH